MRILLDAWALLAWLRGEGKASVRVREVLLSAEKGKTELSICMINLGEVYYRVFRLWGERKALSILKIIQIAPIKIISVADNLVIKSASLKGRFNISYADAFAAATALERDAILLTGDPDFKEMDKRNILKIEWLERD